LILAALEAKGWSPSDVQIVFLAPSDAKVAYTQGPSMPGRPGSPMSARKKYCFNRASDHGRRHYTGIGFQVASSMRSATSGRSLKISFGAHGGPRWSLSNVNAYAETWGKLMGIPPAVPLNWLSRAKIHVRPNRRWRGSPTSKRPLTCIFAPA